MNVRIVWLLFIFLIHLLVGIVHPAEENCYRGDLYDYDNPCFGQAGQPEKLDNCSPGRKLVERCTERCEFCEPGTFSDSFSNCLNCKPCLTECPEGQVIIEQCTSDKNAVCGCPPQPCTTIPAVTCKPCPTSPQCPTVPKQTDMPVTPSEPGVPLMLTKNCPLDIEKLLDDNETSKSISWIEPEATLGSTIVHQSYKPGHDFLIGHFEAVYVFANNSGATIACSFSVSVTAPVSTTSQPLSDPAECQLILCVITFIGGFVLSIVLLVLSWYCCYRMKSSFLKRMCPHHQKKENKEKEGKEECKKLLPRGPNGRGNQGNHQGAAGGLAQVDKGCNGNQNKLGTEMKVLKETDKDTEMKALNEEDKEAEPENNPQNGQNDPSNNEQTNGKQQNYITTQDVTQQSPSTPNSSGQYVDLPPENSTSMSHGSPSQLELSSNQVNEEPDDVALSLNNPDTEVTADDIEELAAIVADNENYYHKKDTFIRHIIGIDKQNRIEENLAEKTDRNTQLVKFLYRGWLLVAPSRKRSDLAAKIRKFDKSLEQEFIIYMNKQDES